MLATKSIPLSKLTANRSNPRKVKPDREAHRQLVASIRANGLLQPLVVRTTEGESYQVVAGNRRLAALRSVYRDADPSILCQVADVDDVAANGLALTENIVRENMHPLDEAEAFARLARVEGKGINATAAEFGQTPHYVRQRMKLASLADTIKQAYRNGDIDTAIAEAFAAVPADRQLDVWNELGGAPRHAESVRRVIDNAWIDGEHALFDVDTLPDASVSRDLFGDRIIVERQAFLSAQGEEMERHKKTLLADGWHEVVIDLHDNQWDRMHSMQDIEGVADEQTRRVLDDIDTERNRLDAEIQTVADDDEDRLDVLYDKLDELDRKDDHIRGAATWTFDEAVKAAGTVFLFLSPDGAVTHHYCVPRPQQSPAKQSNGQVKPSGNRGKTERKLPDQLSDNQKAETYVHQVLAVRDALLGDERRRKIMLVLMLHHTVKSDGLAVRTDRNGVNDYIERTDGFTLPLQDVWQNRFCSVTPFNDEEPQSDDAAYERLTEMSETDLDELLALLTVRSVTAHLHHETLLISRLAEDLDINVREHWRPEAQWLNGYRKEQLAQLRAELRGAQYLSVSLKTKKSELVADLTKLFAHAANGTLDNDELAERVNRWTPGNLH